MAKHRLALTRLDLQVSPGSNYRAVLRRGMAFGGEDDELPSVTEMVNYIDGKVFSNNW